MNDALNSRSGLREFKNSSVFNRVQLYLLIKNAAGDALRPREFCCILCKRVEDVRFRQNGRDGHDIVGNFNIRINIIPDILEELLVPLLALIRKLEQVFDNLGIAEKTGQLRIFIYQIENVLIQFQC